MKEVTIFAPNNEISGVTAAITNIYNQLDPEQYRINVITFKKNNRIRALAKKYHGEEFFLDCFILRHPVSYIKQIRHIFSCLKSNTIVINLSYIVTLLPINLSQKKGIDNIIIMSHSSDIEAPNAMKRGLLSVLHRVNKWRLNTFYYNIRKIACSNCAGEWMFGKNTFTVLNNAIDIDKFKFDAEKRKEVRKNLNKEGKIILGNIGRLAYPKNQKFILYVVQELVKIDNNFEIWFVGDGDLKEELRQLVERLKLENNVKFWGNVQDVPKLLAAMDIFIFPSFFEGSPVALVEAQVNGLPCIISDSIDKDVIVNNNVYQFPLTDDAKIWAEFIYNHKNDMRDSGSYERFKGSKWDIDIMLEKIESLL